VQFARLQGFGQVQIALLTEILSQFILHCMEKIFAYWPTTRDFARDLGVNFNTCQSWRQRGVLPASYDLRVVGAAALRGYPVTLEVLATIRANEIPPLLPTPAREGETPACGSGPDMTIG
jgi:hypothetical protein